MLAPGSRDLHMRGSRVGPVCRTCVHMERECSARFKSDCLCGKGRFPSMWCDMRSKVSPIPAPACHTRSPPAWAQAQPGSSLLGMGTLWPAGAEHWCFHLTRARGAAPLGGSSSSHSSRSSRRLLSPWDFCGCTRGQWDRAGAWQGQPSTQHWEPVSVLGEPMEWRGSGELLPPLPMLPGTLVYHGLTLWPRP